MENTEESLMFEPRFDANGLLPTVSNGEKWFITAAAGKNCGTKAKQAAVYKKWFRWLLTVIKMRFLQKCGNAAKALAIPGAKVVFTVRWKAAVCGFCDYCSGSRSDLKSSLNAMRISSKEMKIS